MIQHTHTHTHALHFDLLQHSVCTFEISKKELSWVEYEILQIVDKQEHMIDSFSTRAFNIL